MWRSWLRNETYQTRALALVLACLVLLLFFPAFSFHFIQLDDPKHIAENPFLNPPALVKLPDLWRDTYFGMYIPVTYTLWGLTAIFTNIGQYPAVFSPKIYHGLNVLLHLANVLILFSLLHSLTRARFASFLGALFFAWHPLQIESIAWVSSLKDLLSTTFSLLCIAALLRWEPQTRGKWKYYFYALGAFALAILSKPSAVMLPICAAAILWWFRAQPMKRLFQFLGPWLLLAVPIALITKEAQPNGSVLHVAPFWQRPYIALDALGFYVSKLMVPWNLSMDYGRNPQWVLGQFSPYCVLFLAFFALVMYFRKRLGAFPRALSLAAIALIPVMGFVPFLFQIFSTVADRYLYFPLSLLAIGLALFLATHRERKVWLGVGGTLMLLGALTRYQLPKWQDGVHIFEHSVSVNPRSVLANNNLGVEYQVRGRFKEAAESFARALELDPERYDLYGNLGAALVASGNTQAGIDKLLFAEANGATPLIVHYNLGRAYLRLGQYKKAHQYATLALKLEPNTPRVQELYRATRQN
ncbi:MAG: tetratricopeptide repeat protein [Bdellovibrionales bacterium]|nr:tetratricopeptide repeat protein [Bdellovibrionales bacterium]